MEGKRAVFLMALGCLLMMASGLPASKSGGETEQLAPVKPAYGDQPIVDTGVFSGWENPFSSNPFGGLFDNLEGLMDRMRQQIASLLNRFPVGRVGNSTDEVSAFPGGFGQFPIDVDLSKGNTTSITKVIDGHTVVINETEYKNEDEYGGTFFKVRIIDVKPDSSELTTEKEAEAVPVTASPQKDIEETADSLENEIVKSKEAEPLESFQEIADVDQDIETIYTQSTPARTADVRPVPIEVIDLSRDTYVNQLLRDQGAPMEPDAETFEVDGTGKILGRSKRLIDGTQNV